MKPILLFLLTCAMWGLGCNKPNPKPDPVLLPVVYIGESPNRFSSVDCQIVVSKEVVHLDLGKQWEVENIGSGEQENTIFVARKYAEDKIEICSVSWEEILQ